jgi:cell filamentation protein
VTFDPFGDFETQGYLRNLAKERNPDIIRRLEHASFMTGIDVALDRLAKVTQLSYPDLLEKYPVRCRLSLGRAGSPRPEDIRRAAEIHGREAWRDHGYLAYAHPFLDGNGRAIMVVHAVLAQRAGISIEWAATGKAEYLSALTKELDDPGKGHLDAYLKPYVREAVAPERVAEEIALVPGLDGIDEQNEILAKTSDPMLKLYDQQELKWRR